MLVVLNFRAYKTKHFVRKVHTETIQGRLFMEELRSTEVLDKEIRSDSVKKAEKILAKADESAKQLIDGVQDRIEKAKSDAEKISAEGIAVYEKNINASLPLEKQRYLVSYIYGSIMEAMDKYFESIGDKKRLLVIKSNSGKENFSGCCWIQSF